MRTTDALRIGMALGRIGATLDAWEESKHPRKQNGQFGKGGNSLIREGKNNKVCCSSQGANKFTVKGFMNEEKKKQHEKHLNEFPGITMEQYIDRGMELIQSETGVDISGHIDKNGIITRYNKNTNEFVKGRPDRGIYTFFKPKDGIDYYNFMKE